ncbi:DUF4113 domain-containing protein [Parapusillimonas granuli]|uniref:DUF4113 domain-containing protein n=1 Tax=Parapusillimonas granuli TaxID=380911 RepID=UPI003CCD6C14
MRRRNLTAIQALTKPLIPSLRKPDYRPAPRFRPGRFAVQSASSPKPWRFWGRWSEFGRRIAAPGLPPGYTRYERDTVKLAGIVHDEIAAWQMRQERMSPSYTTRWEDLVQVWR